MEPLRAFPASHDILRKIVEKHGLRWTGVVEVFSQGPRVVGQGVDIYGERRYRATGQTAGGRYLLVAFTVPNRGLAKVITARPMTRGEIRRERRRARRRGR